MQDNTQDNLGLIFMSPDLREFLHHYLNF